MSPLSHGELRQMEEAAKNRAQRHTCKKGKWIKRGKTSACSECKKFFLIRTNFCPECGADMRDAEDADLARDGSGATEEKTR